MQLYIVRSPGFDNEIKNNALQFHLKLDPAYNNLVEEVFKPFCENLNVIASSPCAQQLLEKLLRITDGGQISLLFKQILN